MLVLFASLLLPAFVVAESPVVTRQSSPQAAVENGVALNRIAANGIVANKLTANRLASNRLAGNRLASNRLAGNGVELHGNGAGLDHFVDATPLVILRAVTLSDGTYLRVAE